MEPLYLSIGFVAGIVAGFFPFHKVRVERDVARDTLVKLKDWLVSSKELDMAPDPDSAIAWIAKALGGD